MRGDYGGQWGQLFRWQGSLGVAVARLDESASIDAPEDELSYEAQAQNVDLVGAFRIYTTHLGSCDLCKRSFVGVEPLMMGYAVASVRDNVAANGSRFDDSDRKRFADEIKKAKRDGQR